MMEFGFAKASLGGAHAKHSALLRHVFVKVTVSHEGYGLQPVHPVDFKNMGL